MQNKHSAVDATRFQQLNSKDRKKYRMLRDKLKAATRRGDSVNASRHEGSLLRVLHGLHIAPRGSSTGGLTTLWNVWPRTFNKYCIYNERAGI